MLGLPVARLFTAGDNDWMDRAADGDDLIPNCSSVEAEMERRPTLPYARP